MIFEDNCLAAYGKFQNLTRVKVLSHRKGMSREVKLIQNPVVKGHRSEGKNLKILSKCGQLSASE